MHAETAQQLALVRMPASRVSSVYTDALAPAIATGIVVQITADEYSTIVDILSD